MVNTEIVEDFVDEQADMPESRLDTLVGSVKNWVGSMGVV